MSSYLFQVSYTADSWATQVRTQDNVIERIQPLLKACHGKLDCIYYAFGDVDLVAVIEFPTPENAAAFSLAASAGGSVRFAKTTPLLSVEQGMKAMHTAHTAGKTYQPPTTVSLVEQRAPAKVR